MTEDYVIVDFSDGKIEVQYVVTQTHSDTYLLLEFHRTRGYTWFTDEADERKLVKKALAEFLGYVPELTC